MELNDALIAAALLKRVSTTRYLHSFVHERVLKRRPYRTREFTIIPDAFLDFCVTVPDGKQRRPPLLLEHDRGSEEQHYFRRRIRAYLSFLHAEAYKQLLGTRSITVIFTTFVGQKRLEQMRLWMRAELAATYEPLSVGGAFLFAAFDRPLEPCRIWLEPCWYMAYEAKEQPFALLGE